MAVRKSPIMKIPALKVGVGQAPAHALRKGMLERDSRSISKVSRTKTEDVRIAPQRLLKLPPGMVLAERYRIIRTIGRGGMGHVYRAHDLWLGREVALKVMSKKRAGGDSPAERFAREARTMAAVESPHLAPIYDLGTDGDCLFLVMRYVSAPPLSKILSAQGALAPQRAVSIVCQVLAALQVMHDKGFVHRDVKPSNVLVDERDHATLLDLGIVYDPSATPLTSKGTVLGTPAYMSPEQMAGRPVDHRSDLYSAGILLMYTLTGRLALRGNRSVMGEAMRARAQRLPSPWARVMKKALDPEPVYRFASAADMSRAVSAALHESEGEPVLSE